MSPTPTRINSTTPWTGCWSGRRRSRRSSPEGTSATGPWSSTTSPAVTTRGRPARWPASATTRDGKTGCPIIVYGELTDADGRPIAVHVYPGNTGDPKTIPDQVEALAEEAVRTVAGGAGRRSRHAQHTNSD